MNHKHVFGKLALSAALLAASAGTAHASADSSTTDRSLHNVKIYHTEAGPVASSVRILPAAARMAAGFPCASGSDSKGAASAVMKRAFPSATASFLYFSSVCSQSFSVSGAYRLARGCENG